MVGYNAKTSKPFRPKNQVWDFEEHNTGATSYNGNLTRVDWFGMPLAMRLHCHGRLHRPSPGQDLPHVLPGAPVDLRRIPERGSKGVGYLRDISKTREDYQCLAMMPAFSTGGSQGHYWDAYAKACGVTGAGACVGINDPRKSSGLYRHVLDLPASQHNDWNYQYKKAPCTFYGYFLHRRAFYHLQYTFPYDDYDNWSSYIANGNAQWLEIAVGY